MFVKRFKRKCSVRGCKNTSNVYLVSQRREMGGTIGICTDCLKEAAQSIQAYTEPEKKVVREDTPLFPHPELDVTISSVTNEEPEPTEVIVEEAEENPIVAEDTVTEVIDKPKATNTAKAKTTTNKGKKKKK